MRDALPMPDVAASGTANRSTFIVGDNVTINVFVVTESADIPMLDLVRNAARTK